MFGDIPRAELETLVTTGHLQDRLVACMRRSELEYVPTSVASTAAMLSGLRFRTEWWSYPDPALAAKFGYGYFVERASALDSDTRVNPSYQALSPAAQQKYARALTLCADRSLDRPPMSVVDQANVLVSHLDAGLHDSITVDIADGSVGQKYHECMMAADAYDVRSPEQIYDLIILPFASNTGIYDLDPRSAKYQRLLPAAVAFERKVASTDATCRLAVADQLVPLIEKATDEWGSTFRQDIDRLRARWST